jgi:predicted HTH transcriptional regulator
MAALFWYDLPRRILKGFAIVKLADILNNREGLHFEAKAATNGLPGSLWESYSAFANTDGGTIVLGMSEDENRQLHVTGVPNAEQLIANFWNTINNQGKVNKNILASGDVYASAYEGTEVIIINVPRADRLSRPVFINNNMSSGTYRRNGEGDYHCTPEEIKELVRDSSAVPVDSYVLTEFSLDALDMDTLSRFRTRMENFKPDHPWNTLPPDEFLCMVGAADKDDSGKPHPTRAGLLFFGHDYIITKEFPQYFLDYREELDPSVRWTDRVNSSTGEWSGNLYDFYYKISNRVTEGIKRPFEIAEDNISRIDDTPAHKAVREALTNCLVHADHFGRRGIVVVRTNETLTMANPGGLRMPKAKAIAGGNSDPRNPTLLKMFSLVDVGERAGSGLSNIFNVWRTGGFAKQPELIESFSPDRVELTLPLLMEYETNAKSNNEDAARTQTRQEEILAYLGKVDKAPIADIAANIGLGLSRTRDYLRELTKDNLIIASGTSRSRTYSLFSADS